MTYNFDPDRWYKTERAFIEARFQSGAISEPEYEQALNNLDKKHHEMWKRLDGSYQIKP